MREKDQRPQKRPAFAGLIWDRVLRGVLAPALGRGFGNFFLLAGLTTEAHGLGKLRTLLSVARRDHRVVGGQAPLLAILLRCQAASAEMTLQRLVATAVLQADDVVVADR